MYEVRTTKQFKSAYKRIARSGKFDRDIFEKIVSLLKEGVPLPPQYYDHTLTGNLTGRRECHIRGDTLLVYEIHTEIKIILLDNIGNHAQVFES